MQPMIHLNWVAMVAAMLAVVLIGFVWYGPLLGRAWLKEIGIAADHKPDPKIMQRGMILMVIGAALMVYVLAHSIEVWRPSSWKLEGDQPHATYGFFGALFPWLGFYIPLLFNSVAWEGRSWKLFSINAGYHFAALLAAGMILAFWR
jgi:hypothetical protein